MQRFKGKTSVADKSKIVDLWYHKRNQIKQKNKRNFFRRLGLISITLFINLSLVISVYFLSSGSLFDSVKIYGLVRTKPELVLKKMFLSDGKAAWMLKTDKDLMEKRIKRYNPLIANVEIKAVLFPLEPSLRVYLNEELPWARFSNGWLLTSSGRIIADSEFLDFDEQSFASQTLIFSEDDEYKFWAKQGKNIQKLIYSVNTQLPELALKSIELKKVNPIKLMFVPDIEINLGYWDENILNRTARLSSTNSVIKKYLNTNPTLDLSDSTKAILKIRKDIQDKPQKNTQKDKIAKTEERFNEEGEGT